MTAPREEEMDPRPEESGVEGNEESREVGDAPESAGDPAADEADREEPEPESEPEQLSPLEILAAERAEFEGKWLRVVLDNFERALQSTGDSSDTEESGGFRDGVELIFQKFRGMLKDQGVKPMEALGSEFDPKFHEAVGQLPREGVEPGQVIEVVQQGFHFGDMVLRPARVIISS